MISRDEILKGKSCPPELEVNLANLLDKLNKVRTAYALPMTVTSGFRDLDDMKRIYGDKPFPTHSKHLTCEAADIYDPDNKVKSWVNLNISLMEEIGLWFESFESTPNWVHFQIVPPASGKRFFIP